MDHQITVLFNSMINQDSGSQLDGLHQYLSRQRCFQGIVLGLIRVRECRPSRMIDKKADYTGIASTKTIIRQTT